MRPTPVLAATLSALTLLAADSARAQAGLPSCSFRGSAGSLAERASPLDSVRIALGDAEAKLCYGRPSARGRTMVGGQDPYGSPWRLGANEPTTLHLGFPATIGDVAVAPGSYSLYAIPTDAEWTIVLNRSTDRWGIPIDAGVRSADVGSFTVTPSELPELVETLTFSFEPSGAESGALVYRWERRTFRIPISAR